MDQTTLFISVEEIKDTLGISKSKAYRIARQLNDELKAQGFLVIAGRVSRKYFNERFYGFVGNEEEGGGN